MTEHPTPTTDTQSTLDTPVRLEAADRLEAAVNTGEPAGKTVVNTEKEEEEEET